MQMESLHVRHFQACLGDPLPPQSICAKVVVIRHCGSPCGILSASFFALLVSSVAMKTSLAAFSLWREDDTEFTTCKEGFHFSSWASSLAVQP